MTCVLFIRCVIDSFEKALCQLLAESTDEPEMYDMTVEIDNGKRREVAALLRGLDTGGPALLRGLDADGRMMTLTNEVLSSAPVTELGLCHALADAGFDPASSIDVWRLLAGLIDRPTCVMRRDCEHGGYTCSACGRRYSWPDAYDELGDGIEFSYCPVCGTEVREIEC